MLATVVYARNQFDAADREIKQIKRRRRIDKLAPKTTLPFIAILNGSPLLRANKGWHKSLKDGDILVFIVRLQGGGGGSNPLKIVLLIGLSIVAPYAGAAIANGLGVAGATAFGISASTLIAGAVTIAGRMLINAMIPDASPANRSRVQTTQSASPTYNISAQGNSARLLEAIPVQYGRHLSYPDYAAQPYTEYQGNEQYLYQLFCIGQGEYEIESIRIEDTDISSFEEITYEVVVPGQKVKLFPTNVITAPEVSGQELTQTYLGGFVVNPPLTKVNKIAIDVVCPKGLFYANDDGGLNAVSLAFKTEAREIDDLGAAIGSWVSLGTEVITAANSTAIRKSYTYTVTEARYEVRMIRIDAKNTNSRYGHEVNWVSLRAYIPGTENYDDVTLLAVRARATNNLSAQSSRRFNVISTRKLPIFTGSLWTSATVTKNPAWAMADVLRSQYGGKLADSRIDLIKLLSLASTYESRGDEFNARFDSTTTIFEALSTVGEAVRTKPYSQGAVWHFWRDEPQTLPVAMFNMRNIIHGSVRTNYLTPNEDTADCIDVEFFNETSWSWDQVRAKLPDATEFQPAKKRIIGVTKRDHAWREGMYQAAANRYRRNFATLNTEMEGFIPTYGDLTAVQHDRPRWGQAGDVVAYDDGTMTITVSEPLDFTAAGNHYFRFKLRNGSATSYYLATAGANEYEAILDSALAFTPDTGIDRERTTYHFGPSDKVDKLCLTRSVRPRSLTNVELNFVIEDDAVHTADTGSAPAASVNWNLPILIAKPVVTGIVATLGGNSGVPLVNVNWVPAAGADYYHVQYSYDDQLSWTTAGEPIVNQIVFPANRSNVAIRVRGIGRVVGDWETITASNLFLAPPPDVATLLVSTQTDGTRQFDWTLPGAKPPDLSGFIIKYRLGADSGWTWDDLTPMHDGLLTASPWETNLLSAGGYTFAIKAIDDSGIESESALFVIAELSDPRLAGMIYNVLPHTQGWPGTKNNCHIEGIGLYANSQTTWDDLTTWDDFSVWAFDPHTDIYYEHSVIDLGGVLPFVPFVEVIADGTVIIEESHSNDGTTYSSFAAIGGLINARYIKIRVSINHTYPSIQSLNIKLSGKTISEEINDLNTSSLAGVYRIGVGDIRLPIANPYTQITQVNLTLQNVGPGFSYELIDKDTTVGPRIKIYNSSNALADATIDALIKGA